MATRNPHSATVLVVDDSAASRNALAVLLEDEGHRTLAAADGTSALELLSQQPIDLILLDVNMPRMGGLELLERVRQNRSAMELPVIMTTALHDSPVVVSALERGANDYVTKPIDLAVLVARMRTHLELSRLARMKDEFLQMASHDLKNPLTAMQGAADSLAEDFPVGAPMTDEGRWYIVEILQRRPRAMSRLIADFLDMGALQDGRLALKPAPLDLRQIAAQSVAENASYAQKKSITLELTRGEPVRPVPADSARVAQVVDNLVGNAIKFCPKGGRVEVAVSEGDGGARFEVRDNGPGLSPSDLARLFVRHARGASRPTGGESSTGLGLALCRQLVELHGGRIGARDLDGRGALFWFELPRGKGA